MVNWFKKPRGSCIGVDLGSQSVKLVQLSADKSRLLAAARWDLPATSQKDSAPPVLQEQLATALRQAREGKDFRGREAVVCLGARELFVQNIRVPKCSGPDLIKAVHAEAAGKLPFPIAEADLRFIDAADVRQGDTTKREVILLACHRPVLQQTLKTIEAAGLQPVAVDVEPAALLRCYVKQFRRDDDRQQRAMLVRVGASHTLVLIARGADVLFIKYLEFGGRHMDEAVARHLKMELADASALRRHNGDRRVDQQDPEIARSVVAAVRPVVERLAAEISLCLRYHSVTFRGQPMSRVVLSGGEATATLLDTLAGRLDVKCELGDPLRTYDSAAQTGRRGQWDVAAGLALRDMEQ